MINQLRIYEINPDLKKEFDDRFRNHASRIMKSYGFEIVSVWYSEFQDKDEFVYVLRWDDVATMNAQWQQFMADKEWKDIKAQTREKYGEMVLGKLRDQVLENSAWFKNMI